MKKVAHRAALVVAGALGALVLALPGRSFAQSYRYNPYGWGYTAPYGQDWQGRDWQGIQYEQEELNQARGHEDWDQERLERARRAADEARRAGDWDTYQRASREAEEALGAVNRDSDRAKHEQWELNQQQRDYRPYRNEWG